MAQVASNTQRVYGLDTKSPAVLIEGSRTNLIPTSVLASTAAMAAYSNDSGQTRTYTRRAEGDYGALRYEITGVGATPADSSLGVANLPVTAGTAYTLSALVATNSAQVYLSVRWQDAGGVAVGADSNSPALPASASLTRRTFTATAPAGATKALVFVRGIRNAGDWLEVSRPQFEAAPIASSFIPTTSAATLRTTDLWQAHSVARLIRPDAPWSLALAHWTSAWSAALYQTLFSASAQTPPLSELWLRASGLTLHNASTGSINVTPVTRSWQRMVLTYDGVGTLRLYVNGALAGTSTVAFREAAWMGLGTLCRTGNGGNASNAPFGLLAPGAPGLGIPFLQKKALSAAEVASLDAAWAAELAKITLPTI